MSPKRRQDRNAFLFFLALVLPVALLVAPLPFLKVASEDYAVKQRIARMQQEGRQPQTATGASAAPAKAAGAGAAGR
jgi:hypothetical protein